MQKSKRGRQSGEAILRPTAQKVLLLLLAGIALGLSASPIAYFHIIGAVAKEWDKINRRALYRALKKLYKARLIDSKDNPDGTTTIDLTQKGKKRALTYQIDEIRIKPMKRWDGSWRIVLFDIPEKFKKSRDAMARSLKNMGFYQYQKSVFLTPYECTDEIDFVIEFFNLRPFVRVITAHDIDNALDLKHHFGLL